MHSTPGIMVEIMRIISEADFPGNWPALLPALVTNLQSPHVLVLCNSLYSLRKLIKRYEYKHGDDRAPLDGIISATFPYLQVLLSQLVSNNSPEAAEVLKICFKIFHSCSLHSLPQAGGIDVNLWFTILGTVLDKRLPEASEGIEPLGQPTDPEARKAWVWWKLHKWTSRIALLFIQRYGNPKYTTDAHKTFAAYFR